MKLVVIGFGQCGSRISDEFARLNSRARSQRGMEIIPGAFAVHTDAADLTGLSTIRPEYQRRILIGGGRTGGHGVGKINEVGAEVARDDGDKIIDAMRTVERFFESDAFLLVASSSGGTGSGAVPIMTQILKERYADKPVYNLIILPFEHEESTEERTIYNSATCLKSVITVADAVFLVDNQRYVRKDFSLKNNLSEINRLIVEPFYDLLCAGEETKSRYIGSKMLDAGDIIQTLTGWTVMGYGKSQIPLFRFPFLRRLDFRSKSIETHKGIQAMDEAITELSIRCNPVDADRALYLLAAPAREMNMDLVKELGSYLKGMASQATIRNGDYPRERGSLEVTLVLSGLIVVEKVKSYYDKISGSISEIKRRQKEAGDKLRELEEAAKDVPSLL